MSYWRWTNMRTLSFGVELHLAPWDWHLGWKSDSELGSFFGSVCVGPIAFQVYASIGNCSSENPFVAWFGLSEAEAAARAGLEVPE